MKHNYQKPRLFIAFVLILALLCSLISTGVFSRYRTERLIANEADYTNTLAESFKLLDHPIKEKEDGSFEKDESEGAQPTDGYTYKLIPGITLPASPYIEITGKTAIPAYLYLEVENTGSAQLTFDSKWSKADGVSGKKGGTVYVYDNGTALTGDGGEEVLTVNTFTVDTLTKYPDDLTEGEIKVYAYLLQKVENKSAEETYAGAPRV